jgi:hypothetical protein
MIEKTPTIYKSGLSLKDIENAAGIWENITAKMGAQHTSTFDAGGFAITYNKNLSLLRIAFYVANSSPVTLSNGTYVNIFDFKNDLPGSNANRVFDGEGIAIAAYMGHSSSVCLISPRPYSFVPGRSNMIYIQVFNNITADLITGFNVVYNINKDLKEQFDQYLGL